MVLCFLCTAKFYTDKSLIVHLKTIHSLNHSSAFRCVELNCGRSFNCLRSYRRHLKIHCSDSSSEPCCSSNNNVVQTDCSNEKPDTELPEVVPKCNEHPTETSTSNNFSELLNQTATQLIADLYCGSTVTRKQVQTVLNTFTTFHKKILDVLKDALFKSLVSYNLSDGEINYINKLFTSCENLCDSLETEHKRFDHLEKTGNFIKPQPVLLGERQEKFRCNTVPRPYFSQFIPMRCVLKRFFLIARCF